MSSVRQKAHNYTYRIRGEKTRGTRHGTYVPATFYEIDGMNVVGVYDARSAQTAHDLSEDEAGNLAPREVAKCSKRNRDSGVDMSTRNTARDPDTKGSAYGSEGGFTW